MFIDTLINHESLSGKLLSLIVAGLIGLVVAFVSFQLIRFVLQRSAQSSSKLINRKLRSIYSVLITVISLNITLPAVQLEGVAEVYIHKILYILFVGSFALLLIKIAQFIKGLIFERQDIHVEDNLSERKIRTQIGFLYKLIVVIVSLLAVSVILMSFDSVKQLGTSILASAGIAGIIVGLAAQKSLTNLLAGMQIAFTQPIRIDDVVIVENEWGRIEEISLTYVVVKIWDSRRLIVPISYFIEKPFQNWTRVSADLLGTIFFYTDYSVPVDAIRGELTRILNGNPLWDGRVNSIQITDTTEKTMQVRALVSSRNSSDAWDLRCLVREKLIDFVQREYPESLPRFRANMHEGEPISSTSSLN